MSSFNFKSYKPEVDMKVKSALNSMLTEWGIVGQGFATANCPVDTGTLRRSIEYDTDSEAVETVIGTNVEYAPIVETNDKAHHTVGKAHFMRDAVANRKEVYYSIADKHLKSI